MNTNQKNNSFRREEENSQEEVNIPDKTMSTGATVPTVFDVEYDKDQIRSLLAFSPNILFNQLRQQVQIGKISQPQSITFNGAALLSDISGFSKFAGVQCARGVLGLSDLHETTNVFLGHFVNTVYRYGGDVVAFAGDALICVFVNNPYGLDLDTESGANMHRKLTRLEPYLNIDCNIRALECAMELRQFCTASLSTHIAVSSGEMKLAVLGGRNNEWVYLLNGLPVAQLECLTDAGSKQVVCTPSCLVAVTQEFKKTNQSASSLIVNKCKSGNYLVEYVNCGTSASKETLRVNNLVEVNPTNVMLITKQFIPKPVLIAINSNILDRIAELRQVVTMFISLDSYSPDVHRDPMTLQPFFATVQESLQTTGGYMRQFVIDDKGCVVIGMWGLPQYSYVNNGSRALYAAADIRNKARDILKLKCSVGVTTGFVFCGGVGAPGRKDYVVMGTDVNMAARFMCKANGRVLVDSATKKSLPLFLQNVLKPAETMNLKGALAAIIPYEFGGEDVANTINLAIGDDSSEEMASDLRKNVRTVLNKQLDRIYNSSLRKTSKLLGNITIEQVNHPIYSIIIGKTRTGVSKAKDFFAESSRRRSVEYYSVICVNGNETKSGSCVLSLFRAILGSDTFDSVTTSTRKFAEIILETYPKRDDSFRCKKLQQLEDVLNFNQRYERMAARSLDSEEELSTNGKNNKSKKGAIPSNEVVVYDILHTILQKKQVSICVQDLQFCDLFSLRFIENLIGGVTKFAMLLTLAPPEVTSTGSKILRTDTTESGTKEDKSVKVLKASGGERNLSFLDEFSKYKLASIESVFNIFRHDYCVVIELDPLSGQEIKELLCLALGSKKIDQSVVDSVFDVTNGNAFWCKAIVDFIREHGLEEFSQMAMKRGNGHNSLKELILKNIDKLAPEQAMVAKSAATIGDKFSFSLLRDLLPMQMRNSIAGHLEALRQSGIISNVGGTLADPDFEFQNSLLRNTIYDLTPPNDCAKAHLLIAEIIVAKSGKSPKLLNQFSETLSYHYRNANAMYRTEALKYTLRTVDDYFHRHLFEPGIYHLDISANLVTRPTECRVCIDLADVGLHELRRSGVKAFTTHFHDNTYKLKQELMAIRAKLVKFLTDNCGANEAALAKNHMVEEKLEVKDGDFKSPSPDEASEKFHHHSSYLPPTRVGSMKKQESKKRLSLSESDNNNNNNNNHDQSSTTACVIM